MAKSIWSLVAISISISTVSSAAVGNGFTRSPGFDVLTALFARDNSACGGNGGLTACGQGYPSNWCCPQNTQCMPLNNTGTQSVLCCPTGNSCLTIQTITCDIAFQDPSKYLGSSVHTANLTQPLPTC